MSQVTLAVGATAEHDTCGSCHFFKRRDRDSIGVCQFELPPMMEAFALRKYGPDEEYDGWGPRRRTDTDRCDCWRSDGNTYIVQRLVKRGQ